MSRSLKDVPSEEEIKIIRRQISIKSFQAQGEEGKHTPGSPLDEEQEQEEEKVDGNADSSSPESQHIKKIGKDNRPSLSLKKPPPKEIHHPIDVSATIDVAGSGMATQVKFPLMR